MASRRATARPAGRPSPGDRPPERSRAELLAAAVELFARDGFEATSVAAICARAGLSKGTFYWNFESKDELLMAVLEERVEAPLREATQALAGTPADQDMSAEANRMLVEFMRGDRTAVVLDDEFWRRALRDRTVRERYARRQRELRAALTEVLRARARELGAPEPATAPEHVAIALLALISGIMRSRLVDPEAMPEDLFGEVAALLYAGLLYRAEHS
jgi:AcrR family transcriptional regulator